MIIAVDYDDTLQIGDEMNIALINKLKHRQRCGDTVILWTCREGQSLIQAVRQLYETGFAPNIVNDNAPEIVRRLGRNPRKVYADVYIDDKAVR